MIASVLQAEQAQFLQLSLSSYIVCLSPHQPLGSLQYVNVFPGVRNPKLDTAIQM